MARTPKRLAGPLQVSNAATTRYTVPALTKTIIRHIHVQNPSGSAVTLSLSIGADAAATRIFDALSIPANSINDYFGYWVMDAAEILQSNAGTTGVLVLVLNGDEITLG